MKTFFTKTTGNPSSWSVNGIISSIFIDVACMETREHPLDALLMETMENSHVARETPARQHRTNKTTLLKRHELRPKLYGKEKTTQCWGKWSLFPRLWLYFDIFRTKVNLPYKVYKNGKLYPWQIISWGACAEATITKKKYRIESCSTVKDLISNNI